jgi:NAD-dependent dihydropyrimidine dehydrogenase PreA subunit
MFGKPSKWSLLTKAFPIWQPITDFWRKTTNWPILGKYARWLHNEQHYDVTFIPINKELEESESVVLPRQVVSEIIKKSCYRAILKVCLCRVGCGCDKHPMEPGCIFMGESARHLDPSIARPATVEEALEHMNKSIGHGLIPQIGRVDADPFMAGVKDWDHFLTLCFCCACCCVAMRSWQAWSPKVKERMHGLEGLSIEISDDCTACGECINSCFTSAITVDEKKARINEDCKGCGLCVDACPQNAIKISVKDGDKMLTEAFKRIERYSDIDSSS